MLRGPVIIAALAMAATALAGCGSSQPPAIPGVVRVVAGENFWGNVAAQIGGRHVRVTSILTSPAGDPHLYESDVANAMAVAEAGLVIDNGAGYDQFLAQLLGATSKAAAFHGLTWANSGWQASLARLWNQRARA